MAARVEITAKYARAYAKASKRDKGRLLDEVVAVTGWSRDNARRRLAKAAQPRSRAVSQARKPRARKYSYDATKVLQRVWAFSGFGCGKYLAASMALLLEALERHGELVPGKDRYSPDVRAELEAMSAATIDRYLAPARARDPLRGVSTPRPSPLQRSSITSRKASDEVEDSPGFFEGDTVAHCGPTMTGEFARTLNLTDMSTGWVFTRSMRNNARVHILGVLQDAVEHIPFEVTGLDVDNGSEFINHDVIGWAADRKIFFTRSRPYKKNDQATIESKNNHLVRRYAFYWRYDTPQALRLLNQLWPLVCDRLNYFTPTKKPIGWSTDTTGRRKRLYDDPATPLDRLLAAAVLSPAQEAELRLRRDQLNPADLARRIQSLQDRLTGLAKDTTLTLQAQTAKPLPDTTHAVRLPPPDPASRAFLHEAQRRTFQLSQAVRTDGQHASCILDLELDGRVRETRRDAGNRSCSSRSVARREPVGPSDRTPAPAAPCSTKMVRHARIMTTEHSDGGPRGLRALVYDALPPGASPVDTACQPVSRHVLDRAQGDIVELTEQRLSEQFGDQPHIVITIRDGDLDPQTDGELTGLLAQTAGGLLVFAVAYDQDGPGSEATVRAAESSSTEGAPAVRDVRVDQDCPECGTMDPLEVSRADTPDAMGRTPVVFQCRECGTVWDSYLAP